MAPPRARAARDEKARWVVGSRQQAMQRAPSFALGTLVDGRDEYLGCQVPTQSCRVTAQIHFDATQQTALLQFAVPVGLKDQGKQKSSLYLLIDPVQTARIEKKSVEGEEVHEGTRIFTSKVDSLNTSADIVVLRLVLKKPAVIAGPARTTNLAPKTGTAGRILEALSSVSLATDILLYLPRNSNLSRQTDVLCEQASSGILRPSTEGRALGMLYCGSGGIDVTALLAGPGLNKGEAEVEGEKYDDEFIEAPPSYDQLPPQKPPLQSNEGSVPSPDTTLPRPTRKRKRLPQSLDQDVTAQTPSLWQDRISRLEFELAVLRGQVATREAAGSPTEVASTEDRLDRFEDDLRSMRSDLDRLQTRTQTENLSLRNHVQEQLADIARTAAAENRSLRREVDRLERLIHEQLQEHLEGSALKAYLDERMDEIAESAAVTTQNEVGEQVEDQLFEAKHELREWAKEELRDLVSNDLEETVEEVLGRSQLTLSIG
ncbi:hypothetical protein B0J12DRAFT_705357 [Macrophomina phaseolina]|uniref:Uncharacterized protein n=1 Tax=Macrophomina phaseolina TaxID=35725 RepID=A0ABQ8FSH6_9PEZI|nr:hypothetical protein B0J12DRAFT_705357 [Macrophomina phaseolina]